MIICTDQEAVSKVNNFFNRKVRKESAKGVIY